MAAGVTRICCACGADFTSGGGKPITLANEYCRSCHRKLAQFAPRPEPRQPEPKRCKFCSEPLPKRRWWPIKYCNTTHRRWFYEDRDPEEIHTQLCVVCGEEYEAPLARATCSPECGAVNRWEMRGKPTGTCQSCGEPSKEGRVLCDPCWEREKEERWQGAHGVGSK